MIDPNVRIINIWQKAAIVAGVLLSAIAGAGIGIRLVKEHPAIANSGWATFLPSFAPILFLIATGILLQSVKAISKNEL